VCCCVAVFGSVLQCLTVCSGVLQCVAVCCSMLQRAAARCSVLQCAAVCCSVLKSAAVYCGVFHILHHNPMYCHIRYSINHFLHFGRGDFLLLVGQCVAVCCSVLQCVADSRLAAITLCTVTDNARYYRRYPINN